MPMIDLSIGFDEANGRDPAGMCVLQRDEKGESHIQNMILGEKAEVIYRLLTTPSSEFVIPQLTKIDNESDENCIVDDGIIKMNCKGILCSKCICNIDNMTMLANSHNLQLL